MESLPAFEKYDAAEFEVWIEAYLAFLRKEAEGKWWEEEQRTAQITLVIERAELVRQRLASGGLVLRPLPPRQQVPGKPEYPLPPYAGMLLDYLAYSTPVGVRYPVQGSGGTPGFYPQAIKSPTPVPKYSEPRVLCPPDPPANTVAASLKEDDVSEKRRAGRKPFPPALIRQQFAEVFDLEIEGLTDTEIAKRIGKDDKTVQRRRARYADLHQRGEDSGRP